MTFASKLNNKKQPYILYKIPHLSNFNWVCKVNILKSYKKTVIFWFENKKPKNLLKIWNLN